MKTVPKASERELVQKGDRNKDNDRELTYLM